MWYEYVFMNTKKVFDPASHRYDRAVIDLEIDRTTNRFAVPSRDWIRSDQPDRGGRRRTFAPLRRKRPL